MIVTDLHGDRGSYQAYRDRFDEHRARGEADMLMFCGDLIHSNGPEHRDGSLDIVLDVLDLMDQEPDSVFWLLGNHEMPHIYSVSLVRGTQDYTPRFEASMGPNRERILAAFRRLPFYMRTQAGWSVAHAGAAQVFENDTQAAALFNLSHDDMLAAVRSGYDAESLALFQEVYERQGSVPYHEAAKYWLAVEGPQDPRYDDLAYGIIVSSREERFELLWDALMNKNELQYGEARYGEFTDRLLNYLSNGFSEQRALISGHITCANGHEIVVQRQLRVASGIHARPAESARYLLLDAAQPIQSVQDLLAGVRSIF
jgi:hypothetical protein